MIHNFVINVASTIDSKNSVVGELIVHYYLVTQEVLNLIFHGNS